MVVSRFAVYLVTLDPTSGAEIRKTRPCVVISPDEMNAAIQTLIVAPMTTRSHPYPTRVPCFFDGTQGFIVLDQMRAVDKRRLLRKLGVIDDATQAAVLETLAELFAP
ncbi:MAG TPA: type II toxin-antitoxin system PemK/MazF family toxin [Chloroflexota bacterium]|nr:type II toxin-antitoxin system PemK/MazF family toxin [Chloroflexota bacterium]